jgi:hypothetical protein
MPERRAGNLEEWRVLYGIEAREMQSRGRATRGTIEGDFFPVDRIDSVSAVLSVVDGGWSRTVQAGWERTGKIAAGDQQTMTLVTRGDGRDPRGRVTLNTEQLSLAMLLQPNANALLQDAKDHRDPVTVKITRGGKLLYENKTACQSRSAKRPTSVSQSRTRTRAPSGGFRCLTSRITAALRLRRAEA